MAARTYHALSLCKSEYAIKTHLINQPITKQIINHLGKGGKFQRGGDIWAGPSWMQIY